MLDTFFGGVFDTELTTVIAPGQFLLCVGASLVIGLVLCAMMLWGTRPSTGFAVTLATLPAVVCVVIMMVNGNVGASVTVAGGLQSGTLPLRPRLRPGDRGHLRRHGSWTDGRHGLSGLCSTFRTHYRNYDYGIPRTRLWQQKPCALLPDTAYHDS